MRGTAPMKHIFSHPAKYLVRLATFGTMLVIVPGCGSIDVSGASVAQVRVIQASPDAPGLDVFQNATGIAYNLGFGTVTSYLQLASGASTLTASAADGGKTLVTSRPMLLPGRQYTAIIGNTAAGIQETVLPDQDTPAAAGKTAVRVVHEASHTGAVDVYLVPPSGKLLTTTPFLAKLSFGENHGYIEVPAGTYAVVVVPAGTATIATTATLLTGAQLSYASGAARTVVLIEAQGATSGVQTVVADDYDPATASN